MKTITTTVRCAILGAGLALASTVQAGGPVFPPSHLNPGAQFQEPSRPSERPAADAWYFAAQRDSRETLAARDRVQASPMPTAYYWTALQAHSSDQRRALQSYQRQGPRGLDLVQAGGSGE